MFDLNAIPIVHKLSHLPIIADPSHGTGLREKVSPMARAAVAAGADGLLIEVHARPEQALSDGAQSLSPDEFERLMDEVEPIARAVGRTIAAPADRAGRDRSGAPPGRRGRLLRGEDPPRRHPRASRGGRERPEADPPAARGRGVSGASACR